MSNPDRDRNILRHMLIYCDQAEATIARFGNDFSIFSADTVYQNAAAMCLLQIDELSGHLSERFKADHSQQPWRQIKGLRNIIAHHYGAVDAETTWEILQDDLPSLRAFCEKILSEEMTE